MEDKQYMLNHMGQSAIICGSAPCLLEEFDEAWSHLSNTKVIAINESVNVVRADFLCSYHAEKFKEFKNKSLKKDIITLTGKSYRSEKEDEDIDYRFDDIVIGATSAGDAIQIAGKMGFSEIVMVGAPMNGGDGYFNKTLMFLDGCARFGSEKYLTETRQIENNRGVLEKIAKNLPNVRSMSGFTKEIFGGPKWQTQT